MSQVFQDTENDSIPNDMKPDVDFQLRAMFVKISNSLKFPAAAYPKIKNLPRADTTAEKTASGRPLRNPRVATTRDVSYVEASSSSSSSSSASESEGVKQVQRNTKGKTKGKKKTSGYTSPRTPIVFDPEEICISPSPPLRSPEKKKPLK